MADIIRISSNTLDELSNKVSRMAGMTGEISGRLYSVYPSADLASLKIRSGHVSGFKETGCAIMGSTLSDLLRSYGNALGVYRQRLRKLSNDMSITGNWFSELEAGFCARIGRTDGSCFYDDGNGITLEGVSASLAALLERIRRFLRGYYGPDKPNPGDGAVMGGGACPKPPDVICDPEPIVKPEPPTKPAPEAKPDSIVKPGQPAKPVDNATGAVKGELFVKVFRVTMDTRYDSFLTGAGQCVIGNGFCAGGSATDLKIGNKVYSGPILIGNGVVFAGNEQIKIAGSDAKIEAVGLQNKTDIFVKLKF